MFTHPKKSKSNRHRTVLITGASEGIGYELARLMAAEGWNLILTARREKLLKGLADDLTDKYDIVAHVIPLDLSQAKAPDELYRKTHESGLSIDALINNAGFGMVGDFQEADTERVIAMLQLNIVSLTRLTKLFLPDFLSKGNGWIMNVGSVAGFFSMPLFAVYAASKAYVLLFSEALSTELKGTGITVTCLAPGPTRTGFGLVAGYKRPDRNEPVTMNATTVARLGYEGMMADKRLVITGGINRLLCSFTRLIPRGMAQNTAYKVMKKRES